VTAIRPAAVAGTFYPADPVQLRQQLAQFLAAIAPTDAPPPKAIIVPHAGTAYSGPVAATAYARLRPVADTITRVVLIGPSHRVAFRGIAVSTAEFWQTPLGTVPVDRAAIAPLLGLPMVGTLEAAHAQEHSLEVQVPFLQTVLGAFSLVPVVAGDATAEEVAAVLDSAWGGPETLIVISTDLSHFLDYAACRATDAATVAAIEHLDYANLQPDGACGRVPVSGMLLAARRHSMDITTLDVRNSGDTAGGRDRVVGYGAWALWEKHASPHPLAGLLLELARKSIAHGLETGSPMPPPTPLPAALSQPGAVFVTLKIAGQLRGCIGSLSAWRNLGEDICDNAFKAAFGDPRFPALSREEWADPTLSLSVSLLTAPVPMAFRDQADLLDQLRPRIDGLIIEDQGRRSLFLPVVWEQLPDKNQFLAHLKLKAGLDVNHWSPTFRAHRFEAIELKETHGQ
jgi:MEMO1 family protein